MPRPWRSRPPTGWEAMWKRIDEQIAGSAKHAQLGFNAFTLWTMVLPHVDTKGRYPADAAFVRGQCLPLFQRLRLGQIHQALQELEKVGLVHLYDSADGKRYLVYHDHSQWNPPGRLRYQRARWPEPQKALCRCLGSGGPGPPFHERENAVKTSLVMSSSISGGGAGEEGQNGAGTLSMQIADMTAGAARRALALYASSRITLTAQDRAALEARAAEVEKR